jgi:hypothetical protein
MQCTQDDQDDARIKECEQEFFEMVSSRSWLVWNSVQRI